MKYLIYSDIHWSNISSLIRGRGEKYSDRIENLIKCLNWAEECADNLNVDKIVCLGDFFNSPSLEQEEITSLNDIKWSNKPHQFLVGNHESSMHDLRYNSANIMKKFGFEVINEVKIEDGIVFIPYIANKYREDFNYYVKDKNSIVFSHNDIAGIQFGDYSTVDGFNIDDISNGCRLFLNGHIHNQGKLRDNVYNVGSTTAHNFTNDSFSYKYGIWILDTVSLDLQFIENPYSFKFYKIDIENETDVNTLSNLPKLSVVSIRSKEQYVDIVKDILRSNENISYSRLVVMRDVVETKDDNKKEDLSIDYFEKLINFVYEQIGVSDIVNEELSKICEREVK